MVVHGTGWDPASGWGTAFLTLGRLNAVARMLVR